MPSFDMSLDDRQMDYPERIFASTLSINIFTQKDFYVVFFLILLYIFFLHIQLYITHIELKFFSPNFNLPISVFRGFHIRGFVEPLRIWNLYFNLNISVFW